MGFPSASDFHHSSVSLKMFFDGRGDYLAQLGRAVAAHIEVVIVGFPWL